MMESQVISDDVMLFLHVSLNIVARTIISVVGVVTNLVSMIVFSKLGLKDSMSVGLFFLSSTDFLLTVIQLANCISYIIDHQHLNTSTGVRLLDYVLGWVISGLHGVSCWITAVVSVERCYCVVSPFKVRQVFTRHRCIVVTVAIYVVHIGIHVPLAAVDRKTIIELLTPSENKTSTGTSETTFTTIVNPEITLVEFIVDIIAGVSMWFVSQAAVIICAVWMGYSLEATSKVRHKASNHRKIDRQLSVKSKHSSTLSNRERRLVRVVLVLAITLTCCNVPKMITTTVYYTFPGTSTDQQENLNNLLWALAYTFGSLGCSISFVVYLALNVNYRREFTSVFVRIRTSAT